MNRNHLYADQRSTPMFGENRSVYCIKTLTASDFHHRVHGHIPNMKIRQIIIKYYNNIPDIPTFLTENGNFPEQEHDNRVTPALKFSLYQVTVS